MSERCSCRVCLIKDKVTDCLDKVSRGDLVVGNEIMSDLLSDKSNIDFLGFELLFRLIQTDKPKQRFILENLGKIENQVTVGSFPIKKEEVYRYLSLI